jgi:hypothetical protein
MTPVGFSPGASTVGEAGRVVRLKLLCRGTGGLRFAAADGRLPRQPSQQSISVRRSNPLRWGQPVRRGEADWLVRWRGGATAPSKREARPASQGKRCLKARAVNAGKRSAS